MKPLVVVRTLYPWAKISSEDYLEDLRKICSNGNSMKTIHYLRTIAMTTALPDIVYDNPLETLPLFTSAIVHLEVVWTQYTTYIFISH